MNNPNNRNTLNQKEKFILWQWVNENKNEISMLTDIESSKKATEILGFNVSGANISAARGVVGLKRKRGSGLSRSQKSGSATLARIMIDLINHINAQSVFKYDIPILLTQIMKKEKISNN